MPDRLHLATSACQVFGNAELRVRLNLAEHSYQAKPNDVLPTPFALGQPDPGQAGSAPAAALVLLARSARTVLVSPDSVGGTRNRRSCGCPARGELDHPLLAAHAAL